MNPPPRSPVEVVQNLNNFPLRVTRLVAELIDEHNVRVRVQSGEGHLYLYADDGSRPFKVSASRDEAASMKYLRAWAAQRGYAVKTQ